MEALTHRPLVCVEALTAHERKASAVPRDIPHSETAPTIYEVARRAGVSIATVSRALRDTGPVAPATRAKVLAAVEELRFPRAASASPSPRDATPPTGSSSPT